MNRPLSAGTLAIGELGLGGEIRSVPSSTNVSRSLQARPGYAIIPPLTATGAAVPSWAHVLHEVRRLGQALASI